MRGNKNADDSLAAGDSIEILLCSLLQLLLLLMLLLYRSHSTPAPLLRLLLLLMLLQILLLTDCRVTLVQIPLYSCSTAAVALAADAATGTASD